MYNIKPRSSFQQGGVANSREMMYNQLMQQGVLGDMSFEEFQNIPPEQLNQVLQQARGQQQAQQGGQPMPQMSLGSRVTLPNDPNQVKHLTMHNHGFRDTRQYGGPIEGIDPAEEYAYMNSEPDLKPIYGELADAKNEATKQKNKATAMNAAKGVAGAGSLIANSFTDDTKSAHDTGNVVGGIAGDTLSGFASGGWMGAAAGLTGGVIDAVQGQAAQQKLIDQNFKADSVGQLGSSLNTAAYGKRVNKRQRNMIALGERIEVNNMRNRGLFNTPHSSKAITGGGMRNAGQKGLAQPYWNDRKKAAEGFSSKRGNAQNTHIYNPAPQTYGQGLHGYGHLQNADIALLNREKAAYGMTSYNPAYNQPSAAKMAPKGIMNTGANIPMHLNSHAGNNAYRDYMMFGGMPKQQMVASPGSQVYAKSINPYT